MLVRALALRRTSATLVLAISTAQLTTFMLHELRILEGPPPTVWERKRHEGRVASNRLFKRAGGCRVNVDGMYEPRSSGTAGP